MTQKMSDLFKGQTYPMQLSMLGVAAIKLVWTKRLVTPNNLATDILKHAVSLIEVGSQLRVLERILEEDAKDAGAHVAFLALALVESSDKRRAQLQNLLELVGKENE